MRTSRRAFLASSLPLLSAPLLSPAFGQPKLLLTTNPIPSANMAFACDLYGELRSNKGNLMFSPVGLHFALSMMANGAKGNTLTELQKVLHLPEDQEKGNAGFKTLLMALNGAGRPADKRGFELSVANALWGMKGYPWRKEFLTTSQANFGAGLQEVDFRDAEAATRLINRWAENQTNRKITEVIKASQLAGDTRMVLTNAVYFKGKWVSPFEKKKTTDGPFTSPDGSTTDVPLMHQTDSMRYAETDDWQAVELGYKGGETSMVLMLPPKADGLPDLEKGLSAEFLDGVIKKLGNQKVELTLPSFKFETTRTLKDSLSALGLKETFDKSKADFKALHSSDEVVYLSTVIQKAFIEVNEEGTEAAAVTVSGAGGGSGRSDPKVFKADRPFLFLIRHVPTNTVLFLGRYGKP